MGYRSDWQLVFNTAGKADEVMDWMLQQSNSNCYYAPLLTEILQHAILDKDDDYIVMGGQLLETMEHVG